MHVDPFSVSSALHVYTYGTVVVVVDVVVVDVVDVVGVLVRVVVVPLTVVVVTPAAGTVITWVEVRLDGAPGARELVAYTLSVYVAPTLPLQVTNNSSVAPDPWQDPSLELTVHL